MFTTLALLALSQTLPRNASFDYTGIPRLESGPVAVSVPFHTVETVVYEADYSVTRSTTVFKNTAKAPVMARVVVPRGRVGDAKAGLPDFRVEATWDGKPLTLASSALPNSSDLEAKVPVKAGTTHVLRLMVNLPNGRAGVGRKLRILGYQYGGKQAIGQMNVSFKTPGETVFRLPELTPADWGWKIGRTGAFVQKRNFVPSGELTTFQFYPGGFEPIGD
jgi:hypothetical protein